MSASEREQHCPLCGGACELLHRQHFVLPGDVGTHYDVVACGACGFTFARDLPSAEEYEAYYRGNRKYTYEGSRDASAARFAVHQPTFDFLAPLLPRDSRILDVGCSTGELLALFQRAGYARVAGVDPSAECAEIARQLYGVDVRPAVISDLRADETYDAVLLANVLEHIPNLHEATARVAELVRDGGLLFVQVPDAEHFAVEVREPFLEFSIEHINYFTSASLANLVGEHGFVPIQVRHDILLDKAVRWRVITAAWRRQRSEPRRGFSDNSALRRYIAASNARLGELQRTIDALVASGERLIVWGAGSLTARLLATTTLGRANIVRFVDSNSAQHGKQLIGRPIAPPSSVTGETATVLVSSFVYGEEIRRTLEEDMRYSGRVITICGKDEG